VTATSQLLIGELIRRNAEVAPQQAAAWMAGEQLDFRQLNDLSNHIAWMLKEEGLRRGDRLICWADTSLDVLPLFVAAAKMGVVFAPLNAKLNVAEALPIVALTRARVLIADQAHYEPSREVLEQVKNTKLGLLDLALSRRGNQGAPPANIGIHLDCGSHQEVVDEYVESALTENDPHVIFFTSGSTGTPKGVILSHRANYLRSYQGVFTIEPERSVCMFPLFHMAAYTLALAAWQTRGEIAFVEPPTAENILNAVQQRSANRLYCIPAVWQRILATDLDQWNTTSLRYLDTGTSATSIKLLQALKTRFPQTILRVYYGSTEVGAGTALLDGDVLKKPGSVGLPSPGVDLKLSDTGEICLRSNYLTDGYFDAPEITQETIRDGWFHTGDIGALDSEGYLSIVGRLKEIIRTGGESVAPTEVEAALSDCPGVGEVAVIGIPDPQWGEIVCAVVIPQENAKPTLNDLQQHSANRVASFKKPRRLEFVDDFPRTPSTGQIQRTLLVDLILSRDL
jgi:fatty-acyl-CoA synthase